MTSENVVFGNQAKPDSLPNSVAELGEDIQDGGANGHADSRGENCVLSPDSEAQEKTRKELHSVDVGQVTEHSQVASNFLNQFLDVLAYEVPHSQTHQIIYCVPSHLCSDGLFAF